MEWLDWVFFLPPSYPFFFKFRKFCQCLFTRNVCELISHPPKTRFPGNQEKNKRLFDCLVTAVGCLREDSPAAHTTITLVYLLKSVRGGKLTRRDWRHGAHWCVSSQIFHNVFSEWKMKPPAMVIYALEDLREFGVKMGSSLLKAPKSSEGVGNRTQSNHSTAAAAAAAAAKRRGGQLRNTASNHGVEQQ